MTQPAAAPYDDDVGTLIELAPLAALLAAFACWIDRRIGKRFDDLESEFRAAHEQTCKRFDDLESEFRAAHERTCKRFDDLGQRIDDLNFGIRDAHEQAGRRIEAADRRTGP